MGAKKLDGIVYSTNPGFNFKEEESQLPTTLAAEKQLLYIWIDSKGRKGKTVTLVKGFVGNPNDLDQLASEIKRCCGTGGSVKDGEIIIQGEFRDKIIAFLAGRGYRTKKAGG